MLVAEVAVVQKTFYRAGGKGDKDVKVGCEDARVGNMRFETAFVITNTVISNPKLKLHPPILLSLHIESAMSHSTAILAFPPIPPTSIPGIGGWSSHLT